MRRFPTVPPFDPFCINEKVHIRYFALLNSFLEKFYQYVVLDSEEGLLKIFDAFAITADGGFAVKMTNKTGSPSIKGTVLKYSTTVTSAVVLCSPDELESIGIMYSNGVADGGYVWVVKGGDALVKLENNVGTTAGNWLRTSTSAAGRADGTTESAPGLILTHFYEIGHVGETHAGDPNGALVRCTVHFN